MLELLIITLVYSALVGLCGFVWAAYLTTPGDFMDWWPPLVTKVFGDNEKAHKAMHECNRCVSGQLALWSFPFMLFFVGAYEGGSVFRFIPFYIISIFCSIYFSQLWLALAEGRDD